MTDDLALVERYRAGDQRAAGELVRSYEGLCRVAARGWAKSAADLDDLMQVCRVALFKSIDTWDASLGPLNKYVMWRMKHAIRDERLMLRTVYIPSWLSEAMDKANHARLDKTPASLRKAGLIRETSEVDDTSLIGRPKSTDEKVTAGGGSVYNPRETTLGDMLASSGASPEESYAEAEVRAHACRIATEVLTERERVVFERRVFEDDTLESIGKDLGLSRERIRQIESIALQKVATKVNPRSLAA